MEEKSNDKGPVAKATFASESYDLFKDVNLLYQFKHLQWAQWTMIFSIVIPFTLNDAARTTNGVMHNLIMYLGITKTKKDREGRTKAVLVISVLENIPQFIVVVLEMVQLRKSVNFVQASNPLISIAMIYKAMGPFIRMCVYYSLRR